MVVQNAVSDVDSVLVNQKGMAMADYQTGVRSNLDGLQRTSVGNCVPSVAARVPCLNCGVGVFGEQPNSTGI